MLFLAYPEIQRRISCKRRGRASETFAGASVSVGGWLSAALLLALHLVMTNIISVPAATCDPKEKVFEQLKMLLPVEEKQAA